MQSVLSPVVTSAAAVVKPGGAVQWDQSEAPAADAAANSTSAASPAAPTSGKAATPAPGLSTQSEPPNAPDKEKPQADGRITGTPVESETQNLAELIGKSEISVLADADGQFVKNMAENQILEE